MDTLSCLMDAYSKSAKLAKVMKQAREDIINAFKNKDYATVYVTKIKYNAFLKEMNQETAKFDQLLKNNDSPITAPTLHTQSKPLKHTQTSKTIRAKMLSIPKSSKQMNVKKKKRNPVKVITKDKPKRKRNIKKKKRRGKQKKPSTITTDTDNTVTIKTIKSIATLPPIATAEMNGKKLNELYNKVYFAQHKNQKTISSIMDALMRFISKDDIPDRSVAHTGNGTQCKVCYCDLELVSMIGYCSHCMICKDCFTQQIKITVESDENILPWLLCPAQNCKAPIHKNILLKYIDISLLYAFAASFIYKHLQRNKHWINCGNCKFGFIVIGKNAKDLVLKCKGCGTERENESKDEKDNGFEELIAKGIMKECPECAYPAMKDYGMCNVMHCGQCNVYWNWRTKDVGSSSSRVKQKARYNGTLWEPGELSYQQNLQRNNLDDFVALLARNGIKYDPNYSRGS